MPNSFVETLSQRLSANRQRLPGGAHEAEPLFGSGSAGLG